MRSAIYTHLLDISKRVTYKSGWWFDIVEVGHNEIILSISAKMPDLKGDGTSTSVMHRRSYSSWALETMPDAQLVDYVFRDLILRTEMHEMDEWLKLDGFCVRDPHPELKEKAP